MCVYLTLTVALAADKLPADYSVVAVAYSDAVPLTLVESSELSEITSNKIAIKIENCFA